MRMKPLVVAVATAPLFVVSACGSDAAESAQTPNTTASAPTGSASSVKLADAPATVQDLVADLKKVRAPILAAHEAELQSATVGFLLRDINSAWGATTATQYGLSYGQDDYSISLTAQDETSISVTKTGVISFDRVTDLATPDEDLAKAAAVLKKAIDAFVSEHGESPDVDPFGSSTTLKQSFFSDKKQDSLPAVKVNLDSKWATSASSNFANPDYTVKMWADSSLGTNDGAPPRQSAIITPDAIAYTLTTTVTIEQ